MADYIAYEITVLMSGCFPTVGYLGEPLDPPNRLLAEGYKGAYVGVKGVSLALFLAGRRV